MIDNTIPYNELDNFMEGRVDSEGKKVKKPSKVWANTKKAFCAPVKPFTKEAREQRKVNRAEKKAAKALKKEEKRIAKEALKQGMQRATNQLRFVNDQATVEDTIKQLRRQSKKLYDMANELEETIR